MLAGWAHMRRARQVASIPIERHTEELQALRRQYRRRFRALRDALEQLRTDAGQLRDRLDVTERERDDTAAELGAALQDLALLSQRTADLEALRHEQEQAMARLQQSERSLAVELARAQEKIAGFENDTGLMRIERDELVARTQRLRALSPAEAEAPEPPAEDAGATASVRAELAQRSARIHELECQVRQHQARERELESELNTWKYRIAPLALHLKMQRDKNRKAPADKPPRAGDAA
jgi:chromosome segregation ATPase